ncbi:MAG: DUF3343 domain-containing protein [Nitrososphaeria archaeon]
MEKGLIIFEHTKDAFRAETVLKKNGFKIKTVIPPKELVRGCDIAIEIDLSERVVIERVLEKFEINYIKIVNSGKVERQPLELVKTIDFGDAMMFRCAAMKLTIDKKDGIIVNISGGGCPDVPYLFKEIVGKNIATAKPPREIGYSLCSHSLDQAFNEARKYYENSSHRNGAN